MPAQDPQNPLLPFIEIPAGLLTAFEEDGGILLVGPEACGKTHILRRLMTLGHSWRANRTILDADLRDNSEACKKAVELATDHAVTATMLANSAIEAWEAFHLDAEITLNRAKEIFPLIVVVDRGQVKDLIRP